MTEHFTFEPMSPEGVLHLAQMAMSDPDLLDLLYHQAIMDDRGSGYDTNYLGDVMGVEAVYKYLRGEAVMQASNNAAPFWWSHVSTGERLVVFIAGGIPVAEG